MLEIVVVIKEPEGMMLLIPEDGVGVQYKIVLLDTVVTIIMEVLVDLAAAAAAVMAQQVIINTLQEEEEGIPVEESLLQIIMLAVAAVPTVHQHLTHLILQVPGKAMVK